MATASDNGTFDSSGFYIGANAGEIFYKEQGLATMVPGVAFLNIGEQFNPYVAHGGARRRRIYAATISGTMHVDVPLVYGGYVKGMLPDDPPGSRSTRSPASAACKSTAIIQTSIPTMWACRWGWAANLRCMAAPGSTPNGLGSTAATMLATTTPWTSCRSG
jgi:hypothetical protein